MLGPLPCPWDTPSAHRCSGWSHFQSLSLERALRSEITWLVQPEPLYNSKTQRAGGEEAEIHTLSLRRQDKPPREVPWLIKPATYQSGGAASTSSCPLCAAAGFRFHLRSCPSFPANSAPQQPLQAGTGRARAQA